MKKINEESINNLTPNEAIVLQQIYEDGEDDVRTLAQMLGMSAKSVVAVVAHLKKRGLVAISNDLGDLWIEVSAKGRRLIKKLWPEFQNVSF
jgi:DNA-binding MarR family transcriptional regulator